LKRAHTQVRPYVISPPPALGGSYKDLIKLFETKYYPGIRVDAFRASGEELTVRRDEGTRACCSAIIRRCSKIIPTIPRKLVNVIAAGEIVASELFGFGRRFQPPVQVRILRMQAGNKRAGTN
jgi:hypothetical protein